MSIKLKTFKTGNSLIKAAADLLREHMQIQSNCPHAIMLSGGRTPIPVYKEITLHPSTVSDNLHIMMSDERMAPENSPENNFHNTAEMLSALCIGNNKILKVNTSLPPETAATQYNDEISLFFRHNGRLTLALLGIGIDGHTASIFRSDDIEKSRNRYAIPVTGIASLDRVSTTPETISKAEKVVFLVIGNDKESVITKLMDNPDSVIAGQITKDIRNTELWYAA